MTTKTIALTRDELELVLDAVSLFASQRGDEAGQDQSAGQADLEADYHRLLELEQRLDELYRNWEEAGY